MQGKEKQLDSSRDKASSQAAFPMLIIRFTHWKPLLLF